MAAARLRGQAPASSKPLPQQSRPHQPRHLATLQENILKGQIEDSIIALQDEEGVAFIFTPFHKLKHHEKKKTKKALLPSENRTQPLAN